MVFTSQQADNRFFCSGWMIAVEIQQLVGMLSQLSALVTKTSKNIRLLLFSS